MSHSHRGCPHENRRCRWIWWGICAGILLLARTTLAGLPAETVLHVSPDGHQTLTGARDAIRKMRADAGGVLRAPVRVVIHGGRYELQEPLVFTPEDSGTTECPIVYEAAPGERPVLSGGRRRTDWRVTSDGLWRLDLPDAAAEGGRFEQLWVNGRRAVRAREPDEGWFQAVDVKESPLAESVQGKPARVRHELLARPEDVALLGGIDQGALREAVVCVYHKWDITRRYLSGFNAERHAILTEGAAWKPWNPWTKGVRYHLENLPAALDEPGEFTVSAQGTLLYKPRPGEEPGEAEAIVPRLDHLVVFAGVPEDGLFVHDITLRGLAFRHARKLMPRAGFEPSQAAFTIDAALLADGAVQVAIEDCEVAHIGGYAVWFRRGCRACAIERCRIEDLGAGGVRIGEGAIRADLRERTSAIAVRDCVIRSGGRIYPPAVGVWIGQSGDNEIVHDEITDFFYTGISVGWRWGYAESLAKRNQIDHNHIHRIGQGVLSDLGGVYTLGPSEGTTVSDNWIHDVESWSYGGWGLYNDEGSSWIVMERNLVHDTKSGGYHQHYGRENMIRNNIFAFGRDQQLQFTRPEEHLSFTFTRNIVIFDGEPTKKVRVLAGPWARGRIAIDNNIYFSITGAPLDFAGLDLAAWRALDDAGGDKAGGGDRHSLIADPRFADPARRDFRLLDPSVVARIGFNPFEPERAGPRVGPRD